MFFIVFQSVVQKHAQGHDAAVKLATLGCPVGVHDDGRLIRQDVAPLPPLTLQLLLPFPLLLLKRDKKPTWRKAEVSASSF